MAGHAPDAQQAVSWPLSQKVLNLILMLAFQPRITPLLNIKRLLKITQN